MEFEYFVHGDMCVSMVVQCTYSGILFGNSSNRGRCIVVVDDPCGFPVHTRHLRAEAQHAVLAHVADHFVQVVLRVGLEGYPRRSLVVGDIKLITGIYNIIQLSQWQ